MNVVVIGSGGREHALCYAISKSSELESLYAIPGNPGIMDYAECIDINPFDFERVTTFCIEHNISLVIPGSEVFLEAGITNHLSKHGIQVFGPTKEAAQIETSKTFAKDLMSKYHIPTASYQVFSTYEDAVKYVNTLEFPIVIKYAGLAGGKGVVIANEYDEAISTLKDMLQKHRYGNDNVVIEEFLEGPEFSLMCFVHNNMIIPMPIAQDHKRLYDNDKGPNTGGMGIYSEVPMIPNDAVTQAMSSIMKPTIEALSKEGFPFTGFLYGGLMLTTDGPKVIEFNCRFGDPEAEVILPKLQSDFLEILNNLLQSKVNPVLWNTDYYVGVVLASKGYPSSYQIGYPIYDVHQTTDLIFHMGTSISGTKLLTNGGRVLCVVGHASTLDVAIQKAYKNVETIQCDNLIYRTDIGKKSL